MMFAPFGLGFVDRFTFRRISRLPRLVGHDLAIALQKYIRVYLMPLDDLADGKPSP
jgi:hypothetical protein